MMVILDGIKILISPIGSSSYNLDQYHIIEKTKKVRAMHRSRNTMYTGL